MRKIGLILSIFLLSLPLNGCGQIIGVGSRKWYTQVAQPTASPVGGTYSSTQTVSLGEATTHAVVCYTIDGTTPTTNGNGSCTGSTLTYSLPITVSSSTTIHAIGTLGGWMDSTELTAAYVISSTYGFTDNFPYSDGNLNSVSGGNWTNDSTASILLYVSSHIVAGSNSSNCGGGLGDNCFTRWTGSGGPAPANQSTQITYTGISSASLGPAVRVDTSGAKTGYGVLCYFNPSYSADTCQLFKVVSGTGTLLEDPGTTVSGTATVKLTASGTNPTVLTVTVNGSTYTTYTDSSSPITTGTWGIDSFSGSDTHIDQAVGTAP